jgi:hypothetical protein
MQTVSKRTGKLFSEKFSEVAVKLGLAFPPGEEAVKKPKAEKPAKKEKVKKAPKTKK